MEKMLWLIKSVKSDLQSFLVLLTFWPNNSFSERGCLVHWKMFSSSPGLYPPNQWTYWWKWKMSFILWKKPKWTFWPTQCFAGCLRYMCILRSVYLVIEKFFFHFYSLTDISGSGFCWVSSIWVFCSIIKLLQWLRTQVNLELATWLLLVSICTIANFWLSQDVNCFIAFFPCSVWLTEQKLL